MATGTKVSSFFHSKLNLAIIFLIIIILIVTVSASVLLLNNNISTNQQADKDFAEFVIKVDRAISAEDKNQSDYHKFKTNIGVAKATNDITKKYETYLSAIGSLQSLYSLTNHSYLYKIINEDAGSFAKYYFPENYKETDFRYPCQDTQCAPKKQPDEILAIAEEINNSDLPDELKKYIALDLINTGYADYDDHTYAMLYLMTVINLENSSSDSPTGENIRIANRLRNYIRNTYPVEYEYLNENIKTGLENHKKYQETLGIEP